PRQEDRECPSPLGGRGRSSTSAACHEREHAVPHPAHPSNRLLVQLMSPLPPKADMFGVEIDVCFVPLADRCLLSAISGHNCPQVIPCSSRHHKFDHRPSCRKSSSRRARPSRGVATSRWSLLSFPRWHSA